MKKIITILLAILLVILNAGNISLDDREQSGKRVLEVNVSYFEAEFNLSDLDFSVITTEAGEFTEIMFEGSKFTTEVGTPKLPVFRDLFMFPEGSEPFAEIIYSDEKEIFLGDYKIASKIIPAQPSYSKSSLPEERKFVIDKKSYETSGYAKKEIVKTSKSGTMRGVSVGVLEISPVSYDPVKNSLRVYTDLKIRISYPGAKSDIRKERLEHFSPYFESAFAGFLNYTPQETKSDIISYPVTYLIAANEILQNNAKLQEFITWKTQKGFNVITKFFPSTATSSTVDTWVEDQYQNLIPKPSFLLIVGDQSGTYVLPTEQSPLLGSTGSVSVSDLLYGVIGETSHSNRIPSIHVGRFSVNNLTELDAQVDKTLWYEIGQFQSGADLTYLSKVMGVAGVDGSYAESHGNPQIHYGINHYFKRDYQLPVDGSDVNITGIPYYYPETSNSAVDAAIISHVSEGVAFFNYTAHGNQTSFQDPVFNINNVNNLTNTGKYPLVIGNCCLTGSFGFTEKSFGEAWLNAPDKGGIGFIGASMSTYWNEDLAMAVGTTSGVVNNNEASLSQDKPGMYDGVMMMEYPTQSGIRLRGLLAVEEYGGSFVSSYWSAYHLFGDPSLMVYMGVPKDNSAVHDDGISAGVKSFTVQTTKGSYVAISSDQGILHGTALADNTGFALVEIEPFTDQASAVIVVTSQFKKPYYTTIPVTEPTGPLNILNSYSLSSVVFGTSGSIDIEIKNIGVLPSGNASISVTSPSEFITFTDSTEFFGTIAEKDSVMKPAAVSYNISPNVPDQEKIRIDLSIVDDSGHYDDFMTFYTSSPNLEYSDYYSGNIMPGDTKMISVDIYNRGSAYAYDVTATLTETTGSYVTISSPVYLDTITTEDKRTVSFNVSFDDSIKYGQELHFQLSLSAANGFQDQYSYSIIVGITETFESGDFSQNEWIFEGNAGWVIDNEIFYAGTYSARSDYITHNETATMSLTLEFLEDGNLSFYRKVSSEANYDFLKFFVDSQEKNRWSGNQDWSQVIYAVAQGTRTFSWTYSKDGSADAGSDCAWVDNILATNILVGIEEDLSLLPDEPQLYQNYPNPFNPATTIKFSLPGYHDVKLNLYNSNGQLVKEVLNRKMDKGIYAVTVDVSGFNSGTYFYTLETNGKRLTRKMLMLK